MEDALSVLRRMYPAPETTVKFADKPATEMEREDLLRLIAYIAERWEPRQYVEAA